MPYLDDFFDKQKLADLDASDEDTNFHNSKCLKNDTVEITLMSELNRKEKCSFYP